MKRLPMRKIREALRLRDRMDFPGRQVAQSLAKNVGRAPDIGVFPPR